MYYDDLKMIEGGVRVIKNTNNRRGSSMINSSMINNTSENNKKIFESIKKIDYSIISTKDNVEGGKLFNPSKKFECNSNNVDEGDLVNYENIEEKDQKDIKLTKFKRNTVSFDTANAGKKPGFFKKMMNFIGCGVLREDDTKLFAPKSQRNKKYSETRKKTLNSSQRDYKRDCAHDGDTK